MYFIQFFENASETIIGFASIDRAFSIFVGGVEAEVT
jgi:hypothetical protein